MSQGLLGYLIGKLLNTLIFEKKGFEGLNFFNSFWYGVCHLPHTNP